MYLSYIIKLCLFVEIACVSQQQRNNMRIQYVLCICVRMREIESNKVYERLCGGMGVEGWVCVCLLHNTVVLIFNG